jgi:hypothetical protein
MENFATVAISALIGAAVSALGALVQSAISARANIDESLRSDRVSAYKLLWKKTSLLPLWPRATDVTYERLSDFRRDLRDWYFNDGGWLFSTEARQAYEALQNLLGEVITAEDTADGQIKPQQYDAIRSKCSALRTELTNDLQSRKRAMLV